MELSHEVGVLRKEVVDVCESLEIFNSLYENMKEDKEALELDYKALKKENEHLAKGLQIRSSTLESTTSRIKVFLAHRGLQCRRGLQDCNVVLRKIGDKLGVQ